MSKVDTQQEAGFRIWSKNDLRNPRAWRSRGQNIFHKQDPGTPGNFKFKYILILKKQLSNYDMIQISRNDF